MSKTLLLVDDDLNIQDTARDILEDAGFIVETTGTVAGALEKLKVASIDVALIDFNLPDGRGVDLATTAKQLYPELMIILLTGEATPELGDAKHVIQAILTKPVEPSRLIEIIRKNS